MEGGIMRWPKSHLPEKGVGGGLRIPSCNPFPPVRGRPRPSTYTFPLLWTITPSVLRNSAAPLTTMIPENKTPVERAETLVHYYMVPC